MINDDCNSNMIIGSYCQYLVHMKQLYVGLCSHILTFDCCTFHYSYVVGIYSTVSFLGPRRTYHSSGPNILEYSPSGRREDDEEEYEDDLTDLSRRNGCFARVISILLRGKTQRV